MTAPQHRIFENQTIAIAPCKYGHMMYLKNDMYIGRSLEVYGEWYEAELRVIEQIIQPGFVVIDIGANIGTHTLAFAKLTGPTGFVLAFEPQQLLHGILSANVRMNDLDWVRTHNKAVGRSAGTLTIPALNARENQNFGALNIYGHANGDVVDVIKLDDIRLGRCDFIKIDVEGAEADVLAGAELIIRHFKPVLFVESNQVATARGVNEELARLGYQSYWHFCQGYNANNFRGVVGDIFNSSYVESNLLCFHESTNVQVHNLEPVISLDDTHESALRRYLARQQS
jgi:FkbM family methyltransferase